MAKSRITPSKIINIASVMMDETIMEEKLRKVLGPYASDETTKEEILSELLKFREVPTSARTTSRYAALTKEPPLNATMHNGCVVAALTYLIGMKDPASSTYGMGFKKSGNKPTFTLVEGKDETYTYMATYNYKNSSLSGIKYQDNMSEASNWAPIDMYKGMKKLELVLWLALIPLLAESAIKDALEDLKTPLYTLIDNGNLSASEIENMAYAMLKISDAAFNGTEKGAFNITYNASLVNYTEVLTGNYAPDEVLFGNVDSFNGAVKKRNPKKKVSLEDLLQENESLGLLRTNSEEEQLFVPEFDKTTPATPELLELVDWVRARKGEINDPESILREVQSTYIIRGISGYGKTTLVEMLAFAFNTPKLTFTCNPTIETLDLMANFIPEVSPEKTDLNLPSFDEITYQPEVAWQKLTGETKEVTSEEVFAKVVETMAASKNSGPTFKFVESEYVKAKSKGYILEIQEPSLIKDAATLAGLNAHEHIGSIMQLIDGTNRTVHPESITFYTDNVDLEGCRPINQSVIRRCYGAIDLYDMPKKDVISRIMRNARFTDKDLLNQMYDVWNDIKKYCTTQNITDGSCTIEELCNWAKMVRQQGMGYLRDGCLRAVVAKATATRESQEEIIAACVDTSFLGMPL